MVILVLHGGYGCETGCCGHYLQVDGEDLPGSWTFSHADEDKRKFAEDMIRAEFGDEHVKDLDWENCIVQNYMC